MPCSRSWQVGRGNLPEPMAPPTQTSPALERWQRLQAMTLSQLHGEAAECGIELPEAASGADLRMAVLCARLARGETLVGEGVLVLSPEGHGLLRSPQRSYAEGADDLYVSPQLLRGTRLRPGQWVRGTLAAPRHREKWLAVTHVESVCGTSPSRAAHAVRFEEAAAVLPTVPLSLGTAPALAALDHPAALRRGQRVLWTLPPGVPRTAWTTLLADAVLAAGPDLALHCILLDQPPEAPVAVPRALAAHDPLRWQLASTTFDELPGRHVEVASVALLHAMRTAEQGKHVVLLVDSLRALVRAANQHIPHSGKILVPGLDSLAFVPARKLLAAARQLEGAGSVTVLALEPGAGTGPVDQAVTAEFVERANCIVQLVPCPTTELGARVDLAQTVLRP